LARGHWQNILGVRNELDEEGMSTVKIKMYDDSVMKTFYARVPKDEEEYVGCYYAVVPRELWERWEAAKKALFAVEDAIDKLIAPT
jgi:hypothetical protein